MPDWRYSLRGDDVGFDWESIDPMSMLSPRVTMSEIQRYQRETKEEAEDSAKLNAVLSADRGALSAAIQATISASIARLTPAPSPAAAKATADAAGAERAMFLANAAAEGASVPVQKKRLAAMQEVVSRAQAEAKAAGAAASIGDRAKGIAAEIAGYKLAIAQDAAERIASGQPLAFIMPSLSASAAAEPPRTREEARARAKAAREALAEHRRGAIAEKQSLFDKLRQKLGVKLHGEDDSHHGVDVLGAAAMLRPRETTATAAAPTQEPKRLTLRLPGLLQRAAAVIAPKVVAPPKGTSDEYAMAAGKRAVEAGKRAAAMSRPGGKELAVAAAQAGEQAMSAARAAVKAGPAAVRAQDFTTVLARRAERAAQAAEAFAMRPPRAAGGAPPPPVAPVPMPRPRPRPLPNVGPGATPGGRLDVDALFQGPVEDPVMDEDMQMVTLGAAAAPDRIITIRVKNATQLAKDRGGVAALAAIGIPKVVEAEVYDEMAKELGAELRRNKVDADVAVVDARGLGSAPASRPTDGRSFLIGAAAGVGTAGLVGLAWKLLSGGK